MLSIGVTVQVTLILILTLVNGCVPVLTMPWLAGSTIRVNTLVLAFGQQNTMLTRSLTRPTFVNGGYYTPQKLFYAPNF